MKNILRILVSGAMLSGACLEAADKVTYQEHVLTIFRNSCLKCHNPDKAKADLDLSSFSGVMKGGGSGVIVAGGEPDSSKLYQLITHAEEPTMPPKGKLSDSEIDIIKRWIAGGLLETSGSKAIVANRPKMDLTLDKAAFGKPEGPPPMPGDLLLEPPVLTPRATAANALAASPWASLIAVGSQRQILLYNSDTLQLMGVLPFPEGYAHDAKFSRNGKFLVVGGGRDSHTGMAAVWDITTGDRILTVGEELDSAMAADISSNQKYIAIGLPSKFVKLFATSTGQEIAKMKKHTDWVTVVEFSPDAKWLATGDRSGGIVIWEADTGREVNALSGHKGMITALNWRNSKHLVSSSEDGYTRVWDAMQGDQLKNTRTHSSGVLHSAVNQNGWTVTCGRDGNVITWDPNGTRKTSIRVTSDLPVRVAFSHDAKRIFGVDWNGVGYAWDAVSGKEIGRISLSPPPLKDQLADMRKRVGEIEKSIVDLTKKTTEAAAALKRTRDQIVATQKDRDNQVRALELALAEFGKKEVATKATVALSEKKVVAATADVNKAKGQIAVAKQQGQKHVTELTKQKSSLAALGKKESEINAALTKAKGGDKEKNAALIKGLEKQMADNKSAIEKEKSQLAIGQKSIDAKAAEIKKLEQGLIGVAKLESEGKATLGKERDALKKLTTGLATIKRDTPGKVAGVRKSKDDAVKNLEKALPNYVKAEADARLAVKSAQDDLSLARNTVTRLALGQAYTPFFYAKKAFESQKFEFEKAQAQAKGAESAFKQVETGITGVTKSLAAKVDEQRALIEQLKKLQSTIDSARSEAQQAKLAIKKVEEILKAKEKEMRDREQEFKKRKAAELPAGKTVAQASK